ncbi:LytR/AlgR family response regulator transcription factor [Pedobacter insulae]|uniref:Two component transcriptional regulator, LytTR family n=1 Tax=Pedobacter insulae TaxID=414048 RepID=A0A1I2XD40_9SPHI|nr:LytTR family DNA-binding domain-containing protein [Pedobacter insulae]SFH11413.1 two component transcriptional regulator, LytTR family [Pedobacter insulae]
MIRAVIIDDEKNNIENVEGLLLKHELPVTIVGVATNADDAISLIVATNPDLLFLDIQMPGKNGFDVLKALPHYHFEVIFVTAFDHYGIQAVKFSAIDYLLKPVNPDELKASISKVDAKLNQRKQNFQLENLMALIRNKDAKKEHKLALASIKEIRFVNTGEIIRCESSNAYTQFYLTDGKNIMVSKPIFEYEELLTNYDFIRCHQSHLVNSKFIKSLIKEDSGYLLLNDDTRIPISRGKKENVLKTLHTLKK